MALILARMSPSHKGVMVLTHKEMFDLYPEQRGSRLGRLRSLLRGTPPKLSGSERSTVLQRISSLRQGYIVGVHFGWYLPRAPQFLNHIDFYMATNSNFNESGHILGKQFPLVSADFVPPIFESPEDFERDIDLLGVANNAPYKRLDLFVQVASQIFSARSDAKIRLITPKPLVMNRRQIKLERVLNDAVTHLLISHPHADFQLIRPDISAMGKGLSHHAVAGFLQRSKVFFLSSQGEGQPKVLHEALVAGCSVVAFQKLLQHGVDVRVPDSIRFVPSGFESAGVLTALTEWPEGRANQSVLNEALAERNSVQRLLAFLETLAGKGLAFESIPPLSLALPAHSPSGMPWLEFKDDRATSDLHDFGEWERFLKFAEIDGDVSEH